jgi:hypothetical protein
LKTRIHPDAAWELWHEDSFDPGTPRQIERTGSGLLKGLVELWQRHLKEVIQPGGFTGFSRFNLWLKKEQFSIDIPVFGPGLKKMRNWIFLSDLPGDRDEFQPEDGNSILTLVGRAHLNLLLAGNSIDAILLAAENSENCALFKAELLLLIEEQASDL